jgi:uncharacterized integral membrane protein
MTSQPADSNSPDYSGEAIPPTQPANLQVQSHRIRRTRLGGIWVAAVLFSLILLLLLIFILQNDQRVSISYLGGSGHLPLGVALLLAAVLGVFLVVIPGSGRIIQLRITARRHRRLDVASKKRQVAPLPAADTTLEGTGPPDAGP